MTVDEIARLAKVSKSAVSLALNDRPGISEATRQKILAIANEHGYNYKRLSSRKEEPSKEKIRFLICTTDSHPLEEVYSSSFFSHIISGIESRSRQLNYDLVFSSCEISRLPEAFGTGEWVGTILLATYCDDDDLRFLSKRDDRVVLLDNYSDLLPLNCVNMNGYQGAYLATEYLVGLGHRRIGIVKSKNIVRNFSQRAAGFGKCLQHHDLTCREDDVFHVSIDIHTAQHDFLNLLTQNPDRLLPTALFCECDYIALGVTRALQQCGRRVPEDISVIGFDDILQDTLLDPPLTTVKVEKTYMGILAVNRIHEVHKTNDRMHQKCLIDTDLEIRASCRRVLED